MAISAEQVVRLWQDRKRSRSSVVNAADEVRRAYNGDIVLPSPELRPGQKAAVANLVQLSIDQTAMRIASTLPTLYCPAVRKGVKRSEDDAAALRRAGYGWWKKNGYKRLLSLRARHFITYTASPVILRPWLEPDRLSGGEPGIPRWHVRNPLASFPGATTNPTDVDPPDCVFEVQRTYRWLSDNYAEQLARVNVGRDPRPDTVFDVLEYANAEEYCLVLVGKPADGAGSSFWTPNTAAPDGYGRWTSAEMLESTPNRAEVCPVIMPGRVTLDRPLGQFDGAVPLYQKRARLEALEEIGIERGVLPEQWVVSDGQGSARVVTWADARSGIVGEIEGGKVETIRLEPGIQAPQAIDRAERNERINARTPAEYTGECVDAKTEILTAQGWRTYDRVWVGDDVLTLNHATGMAEWQPVLAMNVFPLGPGQAVEMEGPRFSALATLNHRWPVVNRGRRRWTDSEHLTYNDQIPIAAINADLPTEAKFSDALVEAIAWFYTEGCVRERRAQISQSAKKPENVERIRACFTFLFGPPVQTPWRDISGAGRGGKGHDGVPRWRENRPAANGVIKWDLSVHATSVLTQFAPAKLPAYDFLLALTAAQLELFIRVSVLADNCGGEDLGQKDQERAERYGFACILAGRGVSYHHRVTYENRDGWRPGRYEAFIVHPKVRRFAKPVENAARGVSTFRVVPYDGLVWCPTTSNGSWFARRNGRAYFTGNSASNVRTDRRGNTIMAATVDHTIAEAQEALADSAEHELLVGVRIVRGWFGSERKSFFVSFKGGSGPVDYVPDRDFTQPVVFVRYALPGTDVNGLAVSMGQRLGEGIIDPQTARELDPLVDDPEQVRDRLFEHQMEQATLSGMAQQIAAGAVSPDDVQWMADQVLTHKLGVLDAWAAAHRRAQERQSSTVEPAEPGSPETQPGLAQPGSGAEAGTIGPSPDQKGLGVLLRSIHAGATQPAGTPVNVG